MSLSELNPSEPLEVALNTTEEQVEQIHPEHKRLSKSRSESVNLFEAINTSKLSIDFEINDVAQVVSKTFKTPSETYEEIPIDRSKFCTFYIEYRGIFFAILCCIFTSLSGFFVKYLTEQKYSVSACLLWRCSGIILFSITSMLYEIRKKEPIFDSIWPWSENERWKTSLVLILSRAILSPISLITHFYALTFIDLADAQTIIYSNSVFVTLFAHFVLNESWGVVPIVASLITIIGVMIISQPPFITGATSFGDNRAYGISLAVTTMLMNTFVYVSMRFLWNVHFSITLFVMSISSIIVGIGMAIAMDDLEQPKELAHIAAFIGLALFSVLSALTFVLTLKYEEAGIVALTRCLDVVLSFVWQMFLGVYPNAYSYGGASLVLFCITVIFFRKYLKRLPPDHALVKYLGFLMK